MKVSGSTPQRVKEALAEFEGEIYQRPPLRSSVKRQVRVRTVYYNRLEEQEGGNVLFRIGCQAGTYVRKICHDLGEALGASAHMAELRRTRAGPFTEETGLTTLQDLADAVAFWREEGREGEVRRIIRPVEECVALLPKVLVKDSAVEAICHGADLALPGIARLEEGIETGGLVAVKSLKGELVALGKALIPGRVMVESEKGVGVKTERVIMKLGTYPRGW